MFLHDSGMLGLVKIVGRSTKAFSSKSKMVRLPFFSNVVKEVMVFVPSVPSCLFKVSVQNVEELPLPTKVYVITGVSIPVSQTSMGTMAIAVLKKLASAWVFPSGFTNGL